MVGRITPTDLQIFYQDGIKDFDGDEDDNDETWNYPEDAIAWMPAGLIWEIEKLSRILTYFEDW